MSCLSTTTQPGSSSEKRAKLAAVLVGLPIIALVVPAVILGPEVSERLQAGLATLGAGALTFVAGFSQLRERQLIRNTPTSKVRSIPVGNVEVKGQARPLEDPLVSPLTHERACVFEFEIEEERESDDSDWVTVFKLREEIAFQVDDGTGRVLVDADDADLELDREERVHVDDGELPPRPVREWAHAKGYEDVAGERTIAERLKDGYISGGEPADHLTGESIHDRRYTETVLGVGEDTYVFGAAEPREGVESTDNPENLVIRRHDGTGKFILSDLAEPGLVNDKLASTALLLGASLFLIPLGVLTLLDLASVL